MIEFLNLKSKNYLPNKIRDKAYKQQPKEKGGRGKCLSHR